MPKKSAGMLLYRMHNNVLQVMLVHPGGPFWAKKDEGAWSIPKGEFEPDEKPLAAAKRELLEETGIKAVAPFIELSPVKQKSGKLIYAWGMPYNFELPPVKSNLFEMEWPPNSGKKQSFAEVDKMAWFTLTEAKIKINAGQFPLIEELQEKIG